MSKVKINLKQDEPEIENNPVSEEPETSNTEPKETMTDYGVGGVYRSIGGGRRVKIEA